MLFFFLACSEFVCPKNNLKQINVYTTLIINRITQPGGAQFIAKLQISDAPPPAYGTHDNYSSYNEKDEKSDLPPPYQPSYVYAASAYPTAPQAYPPPGRYVYPFYSGTVPSCTRRHRLLTSRWTSAQLGHCSLPSISSTNIIAEERKRAANILVTKLIFI